MTSKFSFGAPKSGDASKPSGGFSFGGKTGGATSGAAKTGGFSFGGKTASTPTATPTTTASKPTTGGFSFGGAKTATTGGSTTAGAKSGGFSFGNKGASGAATATPSTTTAAAASTPAKSGGFSFGGKPAGSAAATAKPTTAATTTAKTGGFSFGGAKTATPTTTAAAATTTTAAATTTAGTPATGDKAVGKSFSFGSTAKASSTTAGAATSKFSLGGAGAKAATSDAAAGTSTASGTTGGGLLKTTTAATQDASKRLANKSVEQIVNEWTTDLETHVKQFTTQAIDVAKWDRQVLENGQKIFKLSSEVEQLQATQAELDRSLESINTQQEEVHQLLTQLEKEVEKRSLAEPSAADAERDKGYRMAESLCAQLDQLGTALEQIVGHLNGVSADAHDADDDNPLMQLVQILNNHQNSLAWIDREAATIESKITGTMSVLH